MGEGRPSKYKKPFNQNIFNSQAEIKSEKKKTFFN